MRNAAVPPVWSTRPPPKREDDPMAAAKPLSIEDRPLFPALRKVHTPKHLRTASRVIGAFLLALPLILIFAPWQQTAAGSGKIIAFDPLDRQQNIEAPMDGRILSWLVVEGSTVEKGAPIAELVDIDPLFMDRLDEERDATVAKIEAAAAQVAFGEERVLALEEARRLSIEAADQRVLMARERVKAAEQRVAAAEAGSRTAATQRERQGKLFAEGLVSERAVELAELDVQKAITDREQANANLSAANSEVLSLQADRLRIEAEADGNIDTAQSSVEAASEKEASALAELTRLEVRISRQKAQVVTAPRDGRILRLAASQGGEMVKAGDPLAVLIPDTASRAVEISIDGNDLSLVREGQPVRLQFEGWPALQFAGWPGVAVGTFGGRVQVVDASDGGTGKFRLVIVPDPDEDPWPEGDFLRQGVRANGWVMLGEVRLGWELWRQFNGFPKAIAAEPKPETKPYVVKSGKKK